MRKSTKILTSYRLNADCLEYLEQVKQQIKEKTNVTVNTTQVLEAIIEQHKAENMKL